MHFRSKILCEKLNQYANIIIYGTGYFAQEIYPQLVKCNLKNKILCFTQTKETGEASIDDIPIISIDNINYDKAECIVLIAVSKLYADEVKQTLSKYDYPNIISLIDYYISYSWLETDYYYLTAFEEYCEYIADWPVRTQKAI